jgi:replicative DNA helicase Mcm
VITGEPKIVDEIKLKEKYLEFLKSFKDESGSRKYEELALRAIESKKRSIVIDYSDLFANIDTREVALDLLERPVTNIRAASQAVKEFLRMNAGPLSDDLIYFNKPFHARFSNIPIRVGIREIPSYSLGKMISVEGIVTRVSDTYDKLSEAVYTCGACGYEISMPIEDDVVPKPPASCPNCGQAMKFNQERSSFVNWQYIRVQERPEDLPPGGMPKYIDAILLDDIVDEVKPGDRIKASAIINLRKNRKSVGDAVFGPLFRRFLEINFIETSSKEYERVVITPEDEREIRKLSKDPHLEEKIVKSIAPSIYGHETIKKAIALALFGGNEKILKDGTKIRGEINLLLVGDPGTAKCITGDSYVLLEGDLKRVDELTPESSPIHDGEDLIWRKEFDVASLNNKMRICWERSSAIAKRRHKGEIITVRTRMGFEIKVTPTHPFLTITNGKTEYRKASDIHPGFYIAVAGRIPALNIKNENSLPPELIGILYYSNIKISRNKIGVQIRLMNPDILGINEIIPEKAKLEYINRNGRLSLSFDHIYDCLKAPRRERDIPSWLVFDERGFPKLMKGIIAAAGRINRAKGALSIVFYSKKVALKIMLALISMGYRPCMSSSGGRHKITVKGDDAADLFRRIGIKVAIAKRKRNEDGIPGIGDVLMEILGQIKSREAADLRKKLKKFVTSGRPVPLSIAKEVLDLAKRSGISADDIEVIVSSDVVWDEVKQVSREQFDGWVYDIEVPSNRNFVANGLIVHNSQLLKYVSRISPRGLYTTGKGSTAAGLTAAVVRDASTGGWTLEAGALVLADRGTACIDEFDKMSEEDRRAIHEAMEQQTISIAKAGIVATLNARTTIIAAANPKKGRYDKMLSVAENINLPPTILSRFDLIYVIKDDPSEDLDRRIAKHITETRRGYNPEAEPPIPIDLLRKYIAYARQNITPVLTKEAGEEISRFYLSMRKMSKDKAEAVEIMEQAPIPITPRQLEALFRLSEARAKLYLREEVTAEDARVAIELLRAMLKDVGYDEVTGTYDVSGFMHESFQSSSYRRARIMELLSRMERQYENGEVPRAELVAQAAKELNMVGKEVIIEKDIRSLYEAGRIYIPRPGYVKIVPRRE